MATNSSPLSLHITLQNTIRFKIDTDREHQCLTFQVDFLLNKIIFFSALTELRKISGRKDSGIHLLSFNLFILEFA